MTENAKAERRALYIELRKEFGNKISVPDITDVMLMGIEQDRIHQEKADKLRAEREAQNLLKRKNNGRNTSN